MGCGLAMAYGAKKRAKMSKGGEVSPQHPGPKSVIPEYEAARQREQEAHLRSKAGDEDRKRRNADLVSRIMEKRKGYSEGGMVANEAGEGYAADEEENEFDLLAKDGGLDGEYEPDGPGSKLNQEEDMVSRIMRKRRG